MNTKTLIAVCLAAAVEVSCVSCEKNKGNGNTDTTEKTEILTNDDLATQNILRAMQITDSAIEHYFDGYAMTEFFNPFNEEKSTGTVDVWPYTSAIEAANAIMNALTTQKESGNSELYDLHFNRYKALLDRLYTGLQYYKGSFSLTSYTRNNFSWSVYGVHRGSSPGSANVAGIENVYDDQQWLVRELFEAYKFTGEKKYLEEAEYLTEYVIDGWDCTLKEDGTENGGITWGPGYCTKHSCSNGPFISPLVWLSEYYAGKNEKTTRRYITDGNKRVSAEMDKSEYYLLYAKKVYEYQRNNLFKADEGVYWDMMGGSNNISYETVDGVEYRKNTPSSGPTGAPLSYNSGTMLSGAADLYRVTGDSRYKEEMTALTDAAFKYFGKKDKVVNGHYSYAFDGFNNWFNGVLMRGWADAYAECKSAEAPLKSFQDNLDYGYTNFLKNGTLPTGILHGWSRNEDKCNVKGFFQFAFAAQYAVLAKYELDKH